MKTDKKPIIGFICVMLSCILVLGITLGLLRSANNNTAVADATADTSDTTDTTNPESDNAPEAPEEPHVEESESEPEPELQWNYKFKYVRGIFERELIGEMAYKSQSRTFNIEDVTLTVSFGSIVSKHAPVESGGIPEFDFYFADPSGESIYTIRTIKEQFFSEKYAMDIVYEYDINEIYDDTNDLYYHYEYAHTEEITIPKELFTESEGILHMVVAGIPVWENLDKYWTNFGLLAQADIKYQMQGDKVVLSKPYEDDRHY